MPKERGTSPNAVALNTVSRNITFTPPHIPVPQVCNLRLLEDLALYTFSLRWQRWRVRPALLTLAGDKPPRYMQTGPR